MTTERPLSAASEGLVKECANLWARWTGAPGTEVLRARLAAIEAESRATAQAEVARLRDRISVWRDITHAMSGHMPPDAALTWTEQDYARSRSTCEAGMCSDYNAALASTPPEEP